MRALAQPEVVRSALVAAVSTAVVCYPRLALVPRLAYPVWYAEAALFLGSTVLWGFVFAWHTKYSGRPVFRVKIAADLLLLATAAGIAGAALLRILIDPPLRFKTPEDYPKTPEEWLAMTLFTLAFTQLFLVFAPFAWLMRLFKQTAPAMALTVLLGVAVMILKNRASPTELSPELVGGLLLVRMTVGVVSVYFFLRGGVGLVWWWGFLLQSRHLL